MKKILDHWQKPKRLRFSWSPNQNIFPTPVFSHQFLISFFITNHWDFKKKKKKSPITEISKKIKNHQSLTPLSLSLWLTLTTCDWATAATMWTTIELAESHLINHTTGKEYKLKPIRDAGPFIEAGGIFAYARNVGMIPTN